MPTDRRTRDRVRVFFWVVLAVVCLAAVLAARQQQREALTNKAEAAQERAYRYTQSVLAGSLPPGRVAHPIREGGASALTAALHRGLLGDPRTARVRVWRPDGLLVFTSDDPSKVGKLSTKDEGTKAALGGTVESLIRTETFAPDTQTTPQPTELLATYVPLRTSASGPIYGVVEIDTYYGQLRAGSTSPWKPLQIAFAIVALLCLIMIIVSFVWSRRPEEVAGFGPTRRETRAADRDEKKLVAAEAEVATLRGRVKELEAATKSTAGQESELAKLRARVAELENQPAPAPAGPPGADPAETDQLRARAAQLEEQTRNAEGRMSQLQSRVTELEAQLRLTTDQLRSANKRVDDQPGQMQEQLQVAEATERRLTDELQAAKADIERLERERADAEQAHVDEVLAQRGQLDEVRAQARMAEEERQNILAEAAKGAEPAEPSLSPDAESRIRELEESLKRSEHERAMLRAGRPETVYEARNRELEDELAAARTSLVSAEGQARVAVASAAGVGVDVIAELEARVTAAEARATEAEKRLKQRAAGRSRSAKQNGGNGSEPDAVDDAVDAVDAADAQPEPETPPVDGSELRSRLVRSTDARRRGSTPAPDRTQAPNRR